MRDWIISTFFKSYDEHMAHLVNDVIRLEKENKYLRDIIRPNSTEINIPSVWIDNDKALGYTLTTSNNTTETYYVPILNDNTDNPSQAT